jgi:hypothetical protein
MIRTEWMQIGTKNLATFQKIPLGPFLDKSEINNGAADYRNRREITHARFEATRCNLIEREA